MEAPRQPFPGLRSFSRWESDIYFGREKQVEELIGKLGRHRFVTLLGPSGCGKSSLARAGLIAALEAGFMASAGEAWRIAEMRPGGEPIERLARALLDATALGPERLSGKAGHASIDDAHERALLEAELRRGPASLAEVVAGAHLGPRQNLLLLVDQFEEIFRFRTEGGRDEADAFVALLLEAARAQSVSIYVLVTMRSEFLGECPLFFGLPEAINEGQYLTPRPTRGQCAQAITGPARVFGGDVEPALVNRLLNDLGSADDQLPLLQHALHRMWTLGRSQDGQGDPDLDGAILTADRYKSLGGLDRALSDHADEAYEELDDSGRRVAETMFRCLTEGDLRRPASIAEIAAVASVSTEEVVRAAAPFRAADRNFLRPPIGESVGPETQLDVSHEALIRQWRRLRDWSAQEQQDGIFYGQILQAAERWRQTGVGRWQEDEWRKAREWWRDRSFPAAWFERYGGNRQTALDFIEASRKQTESERLWKTVLRVGLPAAAVLVAFLATYSISTRRRAEARATSVDKAMDSVLHLPDEPDRSLSEAIEAAEASGTGAAELALRLSLPGSFLRPLWSRPMAAAPLSLGVDGRGRVVAVGNRSGQVALFDGESGSLLKGPRGSQGLCYHQAKVNALAFSASGDRLVTIDDDGVLALWNPSTRALVASYQLTLASAGEPFRAPRQIAFAGSDSRLVVAGDGGAAIWTLPEAIQSDAIGDPAPLPADRPLTDRALLSLAYDEATSRVAGAGFGGQILIWSLAAGDDSPPESIVDSGGPVIFDLTFAPGGNGLVTAGSDGAAKLWPLPPTERPVPRPLLGHESFVYGVAFLDRAHLVTASNDGTVRIWNGETTEELERAKRSVAGADLRMVLKAGASRLATIAEGAGSSSLAVWDVATGEDLELVTQAEAGDLGVSELADGAKRREIADLGDLGEVALCEPAASGSD